MEPIEIVVLIFAAVAGACFGSFINAAALRVARQESFVKGRSKCPHCEKTLHWYELLPLASWLFLRGRCRGCDARISPRYPLVEVFCALPAALCFLRFGFSWMTPLAVTVVFLLMAVALIDLDTMEIPNGLVIALIPLAAGAIWAQPGVTLLERGIGFAAVALPMLLLALLITDAFGGGDIKLMAVCGFLLGWQNIVFAFFLAVVGGGGYGIYLILSGKRGKKKHIAFGPYLCFGVAAAMLYGKEILSVYMGLYGF